MRDFILKLTALGWLMVILISPASGQFFSWGQDPAGIRWKQIRTDNFQVIFPEDYQQQGAFVADVLEYVYDRGSESLGHRPRKISVVLHNRTVVSNGFVSWAPARLEMFTNPPQDLGPHNWLEMLAVHEFRHVVQIDKLNQGVTRLLSLLLGEQAAGIVLGLYVPLWLMEGDAVVMETALTPGGRGRMPVFEQGLRTQILETGGYAYDKAVFGSYKDHTPNYYELGYHLVAAARIKYGRGIWDKVLDNVARKPWSLAPLSQGLKKHAGVNAVQLYRQTVDFLDSAWSKQDQGQTTTPSRILSPPAELYTHYRCPALLDDGTVMALKTGLGDIPRVVALDPDGTEKVLFTPGLFNSRAFSTNGRLIVWSETRRDPRWEHRSWSEIHSYDLHTGRKQKVSRRSRYFAPAVSPDGRMIAAVETTSGNEYLLVVLDPRTGEEIRRFAPPDNAFLMTPSWHEDCGSLAAVALDENGKRIVSLDLETGAFETLFHAGHVEISRPRYIGPWKIAFNGAFSGVDCIYFLDIRTFEVRQLISSRFGSLDAVASGDGKTFFWSEYTSRGYHIAQGVPAPGGGPVLADIEDRSPRLHEVMAGQESGPVRRADVPAHEHEVMPYRKVSNLFNIHSWGPFSLDLDNLEGKPGVSLFSQNILSTAFAVLGYEYDPNEQLGKYRLNASYLGLYPALEVTAETGTRRSRYRDTHGGESPFLWRENTVKLGASVPLSFRKGPFFSGITPSVRAGLIQAASTKDTPAFFRNNSVQTLEYRVLAYRQVLSVRRDLRPRWAQVLDLNYRHGPFGKTNMGSVASARLLGFFPGVLAHHSLRLSAAYQKHWRGDIRENTINYTFPNLVNYPRGVTGRQDDRLYSFSADYAFPLFYPDWSLPPVLYLKRVYANVFIDHARAGNRERQPDGDFRDLKNSLSSGGIDLVGTMHLFRFFAPLELGVRAIFRPEDSTVRFEFLGRISF